MNKKQIGYPFSYFYNNKLQINYINTISEEIKSRLKIIFNTENGELPMNYDFGINLKKYIFINDINYIRESIINDVKKILLKYFYDDISNFDINVLNIDVNNNKLTFKLIIKYKILLTDEEDSIEINY